MEEASRRSKWDEGAGATKPWCGAQLPTYYAPREHNRLAVEQMPSESVYRRENQRETEGGGREGPHLIYGAAGASDIQVHKTKDRLGVILGGFAVLVLVLGLAQVVTSGEHSSVDGKDIRALADRHARLQQRSSLINMFADGGGGCCACVEAAASGVSEGSEATSNLSATTDQDAAGNNTRVGVAVAVEKNTHCEGAQCEGGHNGTVHDSVGAPAEATKALTAAGLQLHYGIQSLHKAVTASVVAPAQSTKERTAAGLGLHSGIHKRKLLQTENSSAACCPCDVAASEVKDDDMASNAMKRTAWDDVMKPLRYIGSVMWAEDGYQDAYEEDGLRLTPKPIDPEHVLPTIGPRDLMVPSLEYEGEDHDGGWVVGPNVFGDGKPHPPEKYEENDIQKVESEYASDNLVDQRITSINDAGNTRGRQLPGVTVKWSALKHAVDAAKEGKPTDRPSHIVHGDDGLITQETEPDPVTGEETSPLYRGSSREVTFRPCKQHPGHGCEVDPIMPDPPHPPAPLKMLKFTGRGPMPDAPEFIVDNEGKRFAKILFDEAYADDEEPGPIHSDTVLDFEVKYRDKLMKPPYNRWWLNVFKYMLDEYEITPNCRKELIRILDDPRYGYRDDKPMGAMVAPESNPSAAWGSQWRANGVEALATGNAGRLTQMPAGRQSHVAQEERASEGQTQAEGQESSVDISFSGAGTLAESSQVVTQQEASNPLAWIGSFVMKGKW